MEITIRRLTPDLLDDYLDFFDNRAFHDHHAWARCYCLSPHEPAPDSEKGRNRRDRAIEYVTDGRMQGYLAYVDGVPVGWCNVNDRSNYNSLLARKSLWKDGEKDKKAKAVVCFCIAPEMRGNGIATALLRRACEDAKSEGYDYLEAYPRKGDANQYDHFHGPLGIYERLGFVIHKEFRASYIVRTSM